MTRNKFFATILGTAGIVKSQQWKQCTSGIPGTTAYVTPNPDSACWVQYKKSEPALNNQCPVCGTMAVAFHAPRRMDQSALGTDGNPGIVVYDHRLTRCERCNSAFWQDSE